MKGCSRDSVEILAPLQGGNSFLICSGGFLFASTTGYYLPALRADVLVRETGSQLANSSNNQIAVRVLFFGAARDAVGQAEVDFVLQGTPTAEGAFAQVMKKFPYLARFGRSLLFAVNQE